LGTDAGSRAVCALGPSSARPDGGAVAATTPANRALVTRKPSSGNDFCTVALSEAAESDLRVACLLSALLVRFVLRPLPTALQIIRWRSANARHLERCGDTRVLSKALAINWP